MGSISPFPYIIVEQMARERRISTFIETGTRDGFTAFWASTVFFEVHTIDIAPVNPCASVANVTQHHADSCSILQKMSVLREPVVLWLDAHWTGEDHIPGRERQCPLIRELDYAMPTDIILIDDARMFLSSPPAPFDPAQWPTLPEVFKALPGGMFVQVVDDVIFAVPQALKFMMRAYAVSRTQ